MKYLKHCLFGFPFIYSCFMLYKTPTFPDALIISFFVIALGFFEYLERKYPAITEKTELSKLEEELKIERLKLNVEQVKDANIRERAIKDSRAAAMGYQQGGTIKF